jgi:hypothetical protein
MRLILFAAAIIGAVSGLANTDAMARDYPWCSVDSGDAGGNCSFATYQHCLAAISGLGACVPNVFAAAPARPAPIRSSRTRKNLDSAAHNPPKHAAAKQASAKSVSRQDGAPKHVSTMQASSKRAPSKHASPTDSSAKQVAAAANAAISSPPAAKASIPLPDSALLTPPPEFDCEFRSAGPDDARAQPQSAAGGQTEATTDTALRTSLDYERQCYQHAEAILRERLRRLQVSVGETIKAVNDGR